MDRSVAGGKHGVCRTGLNARVNNYGPHHGEENPLHGWCCSGMIFFARCNLHCQYWQNFDISQTDLGEEMESEDLTAITLELQTRWLDLSNARMILHPKPNKSAGTILRYLEGLVVVKQKL